MSIYMDTCFNINETIYEDKSWLNKFKCNSLSSYLHFGLYFKEVLMFFSKQVSYYAVAKTLQVSRVKN